MDFLQIIMLIFVIIGTFFIILSYREKKKPK